MRCSGLVLLGFLVLPLTARAGGVLELVPDNPGPYFGGESVSVDVWVHSDDVVGHDLWFVALDVSLSAPTVYAGGWFRVAGGGEANSIARWDGHFGSWSTLDAGLDVAPPLTGPVIAFAIEFFDDGTSSDLYVGGRFITAGGVTTDHIARWDGTDWSGLGGGMDLWVRSLAVFNDGTGPALYTGGAFTEAGAGPANRIARWDGSAWTPLGTGTNNVVTVLTVFDDGTGPGLYAGGYFTAAGGGAVNYVTRWDGTAWSALDTGTNGTVFALIVFDDGTGPALYVGGNFTMAGSTVANYVARWDGTSWSPVGDGMDDKVFALAVWDDGTGQALYAGGKFTAAGNTPVSRIARWDGTAWSPLGGGVDDLVYTISGSERPPVLFAGGKFTMAGGVAANHVAAWDGTAWSDLGGGTDDWVRTLTAVDDIHGTSPALALDAAFQFDFGTLNDGGAEYFTFSELPGPGMMYLGSSPVAGSILHLAAGGSLRLGAMTVVLPNTFGTYTLDTLNPNGQFGGALLMFGFGDDPFEIPDDPSIVWGAQNGALTGGTMTLLVQPQTPIIEGAGGRYLSIVPAGTVPVRLLVTACGGNTIKYVGSPVEIAGHGFFADLVDAASAPLLTPQDWGGEVFVSGIEITPGTTYEVEAVALNGLRSIPASGTTWIWGDVDNNGVANLADAQLVVQAFQGDFTNTTFAASDLAPPVSSGCASANQIHNLDDVNASVAAFLGGMFPCPLCE